VPQQHHGWFRLLLGHAVLIQVVTFLLRPAISYRALELGVPATWLGIISGSFAVAPLVLAIPSGRMTDRRGERPMMVLGSGLVLVAALVLLLWGDTLTVLMVSSAVLGSGHLLSVVGEQSLVANRIPAGRHDTAFGRYTFAAALGQTMGPGLIALVGGSGTFPDARSVFGAAVVAAALFVVISAFIPGSPRQSATGAAPSNLGRVLRLPGLGQALFTSSIVLAAVDITLCTCPPSGPTAASRPASSGCCCCCGPPSPWCRAWVSAASPPGWAGDG
jgi:MFS family permease